MSYLTSEKLGITEEYKDALIEVKRKLCTGELKHVPEFSEKDGFNMATWRYRAREDCGTVCCIGGWVQTITGHHNRWTLDLHALFYPYTALKYRAAWSDITPKEAAAAINNYLVTGKPCWEKVLDPKV